MCYSLLMKHITLDQRVAEAQQIYDNLLSQGERQLALRVLLTDVWTEAMLTGYRLAWEPEGLGLVT